MNGNNQFFWAVFVMNGRDVRFVDVRDHVNGEKTSILVEACEELSTGECLVVVNEYDVDPLFEETGQQMDADFSFDRFQVGVNVSIGVVHRESLVSDGQQPCPSRADHSDYSSIFAGLPMDTGSVQPSTQ